MSIFAKKEPTEVPYKQAILESEASTLKRLTLFIDETTNKFKGLNDWVKKTGDQVNELLKRTFDLQRKVEGQLIDVENTAKKQFHRYDDKLEGFEKRMTGKYITVKEHKDKVDAMAGVMRAMELKLVSQKEEIGRVQGSIPKGTVSKQTLETLVAELRNTDEKIANAIPKNVASADLVSNIRKEIIAMFEPYVTSEALKSVQRGVETKVDKVAKVSSATTKENKAIQKEFAKLASKVLEIQKDYLPADAYPQIQKEITIAIKAVSEQVTEVEGKIPTDHATIKQIELVREYQKELETRFEAEKMETGKQVGSINQRVDKSIKRSEVEVDNVIKSFKEELSESMMGEDTNFIKNIIREITDDEIKNFRVQSSMFQDNTKQTVLEVKNQNRNLASKISELEKAMAKFILLAQNK